MKRGVIHFSPSGTSQHCLLWQDRHTVTHRGGCQHTHTHTQKSSDSSWCSAIHEETRTMRLNILQKFSKPLFFLWWVCVGWFTSLECLLWLWICAYCDTIGLNYCLLLNATIICHGVLFFFFICYLWLLSNWNISNTALWSGVWSIMTLFYQQLTVRYPTFI